MRVSVVFSFKEASAVTLLNWLARENARLFRERPQLPLLYDSGVVYQREPDQEEWGDYAHVLAQGHDDCDSLAAARAGELLARGWKALFPGDEGYEEARRSRPASIQAEVYLKTRVPEGQTGLYHCVVRYKLAGRWFYDDPSARLGMYDGQISERQRERWRQAKVR